uniref:Uncharacterized protein n=1 Tax=Octopus bimaculoides TaxID=37653 RepID=A0A0L8GZS9_OCTBM
MSLSMSWLGQAVIFTLIMRSFVKWRSNNNQDFILFVNPNLLKAGIYCMRLIYFLA